MSKSYLKQVETLKSRFESELEKFPLGKQWHYSERLYRTTGNKKYIKNIRKYWIQRTRSFHDLINALNDDSRQKTLGRKYVESLKKYKSPRLQKRVPIYREIPEFKYFQELIWFLNRAKDYKIKKNFSPTLLKDTADKLKSINFREYFNNQILMKFDPVQTVNTLFFLKNLGIADYTTESLDLIKKLFESPKTREEYQNKLYSFTHIIISDSRYYQQFIDQEKYSWIYNFLEDEIPDILKLKNNDIIAEIGLCYKLAKIENASLKKIKILISNELDNQGGILLRDKQEKSLEKIEHRNVLAILLLSDLTTLYPGPDLNL
ncbi:MAG: DUF3541 domain-containing protein [Patescibacteria group bacterium]|nr:DUF3541 domain-containing protein [Patescibacteria group bacterium]